MKLRNLFLASLAVCTMASCSKDDDGISGPQEVDAYLSFASTADVMTKTSTDGGSDTGTGKEAKIQSLTAYVFDTSADNKYVISKHVSVKVGSTEGTENEDYTVDKNGSINSIRSIHVKVAKPSGSLSTSSTSFKVVLLANTEAFSVTNLADLKSRKTTDIKTFNSVAVGESYLPMHSVELTVTGLTPSSDAEHVLNWYKNSSFCVSGTDVSGVHSGEVPAGAAEVEMTRSIARVQLASLGADFQALQYKNMKFDVSSVFLANVRVNATVMGEENAEAAFYRGAPNEFSVLQFLIEPDGSLDDNLKKEYDTPKSLSTGTTLTDWGFDKYINVNSPESIAGINFTANGDGTYKQEEGGAYQTRLVITGTLYDGNKPLGQKYFHIPLKLTGDVGNVASNKLFKIKATITGEGSPNPDEILENACINFSIEVADWKVIVQTEDDTN